MDDLVGTRATLGIAATPADSHLGQSRRTPELVDRDLVVCAWGDAALHTLERVLAEHGRVSPAHPQWPGANRPASAERSRVDHLVGGNGGRLERSSNSVRVGWQTERTPPASKKTVVGRGARRSFAQSGKALIPAGGERASGGNSERVG